ncbi:MAG: DUF2066 domain-containing protein [Pseudomonadota bacterium]|nr:DUF2066 domain-containing protein [Pseudomonadota bacterium]|tara:strand:+ start:979 stop:1998 length:1020 start_codon:yes stop_codon:yes gene_type:complete
MIKNLGFFFLLYLSLSNPVYAKELSTLFEVKIPADQYTNTNDGLNKAFNQLIKKLSGSRSKKYLWRIGDAKLKKIDFVSSYSIESFEDSETLIAQFNASTLIPELRDLGIPLIGFNRPVILFLLKVDTGESKPIFLEDSHTSSSVSSEIVSILSTIGKERGVYLELPTFDLEDQNLFGQPNILFEPSQYIQDKFYNDGFLSVQISRVGINQWSIDGDLQSSSPIREEMLLDFLEEQIHLYLDDFLEVTPLAAGLLGDEILLSVHGLKSFQDFQFVELELDKIFAIKSKQYHLFSPSQIEYRAQLFQTKDSLLKELRGSSALIVKSFDDQLNKLTLEYIN